MKITMRLTPDYENMQKYNHTIMALRTTEYKHKIFATEYKYKIFFIADKTNNEKKIELSVIELEFHYLKQRFKINYREVIKVCCPSWLFCPNLSKNI